MRARIFSCHHLKPQNSINTELFSAIVTGIPREAGDEFLSDMDGENIAAKTDYSELRQQYYVWKNLLSSYDFVGFEHYRRLFFLDPNPPEITELKYPLVWAHRQQVAANTLTWVQSVSSPCLSEYMELRRDLDAEGIEAIKRWISSYDFVVTRPKHVNIRWQWERVHPAAIPTWSQTVSYLHSHSYFANKRNYFSEEINSNYYLNMYIMRTDYFDEYMKFLMDILTYLESASEVISMPRLWGYIGERIFSIYLHQKRLEKPLLRVAEVPYLREDPDAKDTEPPR